MTSLRVALAALLLTLAAALPVRAQEFVANQIEGLISTDTIKVEIDGLSGAFSGNVRIETLKVSDPDGVFLNAEGLALDWSPLALVRKNVEIQNLSAERITLDRLPDSAPADPNAPDGGGFSLPAITANVGQIEIKEFVLGQAVAGVPARLAATASLTLADDPVQLDVKAAVKRLDQPGDIALTLGFAPAENRLQIEVNASEPAGGIVAGLLKLPNSPPVVLRVAGSGPLSDFSAEGSLDLSGTRAATLSARVADEAAGRRITATASTITAPFVPDRFRDIVGAKADLAVNVILRSDGPITVDQGHLESGALKLDVAGTLDRAGPGNDLRVTLRTDEGNPVPIAAGEGAERAEVELSSLDATLKGALSAAAIEASTAVRTASAAGYAANGVTARLASPGFNFNALTGPYTVSVEARSATAPSDTEAGATAGRFLSGPVAFAVDGVLDANAVTVKSATAKTAVANASASGNAALDLSTFALTLASDFETRALSDAAVDYVGPRTALSAKVARTAEGNFSASGLSVKGDALSITGEASLDNGKVSAKVDGTLDQRAIPNAGLTGQAAFHLAANGPLSAPNVDLTATADGVLVAGRELKGLDARIQGTFAPDAPRGMVAVKGSLSGTPLELTADFSTAENGARTLRNLLLRQDQNTVSGEVVLGTDNKPTGHLDLKLPDISTLASLAGQDASGDLSGTVALGVETTTPVADANLSSASLSVAGNELTGATIKLRIADYLSKPLAAGRVAAANLAAGSLTVADLAVDLSDRNGATGIDARASVNAVPVALGGAVGFTGTGIDVDLDRLTADVPNARVNLRRPAALAIAGGSVSLDALDLGVGGGSVTASGKAGGALDLRLALDAVPLSVVNPFVPGLDAAGTVSGSASANGPSGNPNAAFELALSGVQTSQTRAAKVPAVNGRLAGTYDDGTTTLRAAHIDLGTGAVEATGTVGRELDLSLRLVDVPISLANGFVDGLDASGTVNGTAAATGSLDDPSVTFSVAGSGITAEQVRRSGIEPLSLDLAGTYREGTARLQRARVAVGEGSVNATGSVGRDLDLKLALDAVPVGLANGFVPDLAASGTISGNATATGSIADPTADFTLTGRDITAAPLKRSAVPPLALDAAGAYANGTLTLRTANVQVGSGRLSASGTVGQALALKVLLDKLPAGLANAFAPDLDIRGTLSGEAEATGTLADPNARFSLTSDGLSAAPLRRAGVDAVGLDVAGAYADETATIERGNVRIGDGRIAASGTVGRRLDVRAELTNVPVGVADGFVPNLGARGTVSGTLAATGTLAAPSATFDIRADGVSVAETRAAGAPPLDAVARGAFANGTATLETARIDLGRGGRVEATGTVGRTLDVDVRLTAIPASLAAAVAPDLAPTGTLAGTVRARGALANPSVDYDLRVDDLSVAQTRDAGVSPLDIAARGRFADKVVTTDATLSGAGGLAFRANGSVNVAGTPSFDLALNGTAPLALANRILAENGRSVKGTVRVDARVTGTAAAPNVVGTVSTSGASFTDTGANLAINGINATIALNGRSASFSSFSARLASGGTITVGGTIGLDGGFPADLTVGIADGRYADGELFSARLDARLTLTGDLTGSPVLAGTIDAREINVLVPERLPTSLAQINVKRRNTPAAVLKQLREINPDTGASGASSGGISLDITFNAPNRVFVRGRGLDLELGGSIAIKGPVSALSITGGFELQRGRLQILSRRLNFERATLSFNGELLPTLDFLATSDTGEVTVNIAVTGPATDPSFSFSSTPALPQDEVLARLIFNQGTTELSPLQIAQLAAAAAQLAGVGGSTGLLDNLRSQLGVDDLDIRTNADGQTTVGVGRYINDNTYVGVDSSGRVAIDLKLGADVKARAAVTPNGGGEVGVFYEREY